MPKQKHDLPISFRVYSSELGKEIGARIRGRRRNLQLTQERLRVRVELENVLITRSQLSRIEKGERLPLASEIIALSRVLKVSLEWLLLGNNEN